MLKLSMSSTWEISPEKSIPLDDGLIQALIQIDLCGSLQEAAKAQRVPYRTFWAYIQKYNRLLEQPLVQTAGRGGASLTELGHRLRWMHEQARVRMQGPLLSNQTRLQNDWRDDFLHRLPALTVASSDDRMLNTLLAQLAVGGHLRVVNKSLGSVGALSAMHRGEVMVAGCHVPMGLPEGALPLVAARRWMKDKGIRCVRFLIRQTGWMTRQTQSGSFDVLKAVAGKQRLINRNKASSTRMLSDHLIFKSGLVPSSIEGYEDEEDSHLGVACAIASGQADFGLGVAEAADTYRLGFVPVCEEFYVLVAQEAFFDTLQWAMLRDAMNHPSLAPLIQGVKGYRMDRIGEVCRPSDLGI